MKKNRSILEANDEEISARIVKFIARPISFLVIKYTNITPNQMSLISFLFVIASCFFLIQGGYINRVIGSILAILYLMFDCIDGAIARAKKTESKLGMWLDGIIGFIAIEVILFCFILGLNTQLANIIGLLAIICFPMQFTIVHFYKSEIVKSNKPMKIGNDGKLEFLRYLYGSSLFYILIVVSSLINRPLWFLLFFAIFGNLFWMGLVGLQYINLKAKKISSK